MSPVGLGSSQWAGVGLAAPQRMSGLCAPRAGGCHQVDADYLRVGSQGHFRVPGR